VAEGMAEEGGAINLGWHGDLSSDETAKVMRDVLTDGRRRLKMSCKAQGLVDGEGVERLVMHLKGHKLRLRAVKEEDCKLLWELANDPEVRAASFSSKPIPWEEHVNWFRSKQSDTSCLFLLALNEIDEPIGQVRFDLDGSRAVVSVSLRKEFRGKSYGSEVIRIASQRLFETSNVNSIVAYVKLANKASVHAFVNAGFKQKGLVMIYGQEAFNFLLEKGYLYHEWSN
jgi:RimJ/RimL family protein N-acetyltransferase